MLDFKRLLDFFRDTKPVVKATAGIAGAAIALIAGWEGLSLKSYPDPVSHGAPWTACYGETKGVQPGQTYTVAACNDMLDADVQVLVTQINAIIPDATDGQKVAFIDFSYNVGFGAFQKSSMLADFRAGNLRKSCDDLLKYSFAHDKHGKLVQVPGLFNRRSAEREICLKGL